jgi:hypothetical protein
VNGVTTSITRPPQSHVTQRNQVLSPMASDKSPTAAAAAAPVKIVVAAKASASSAAAAAAPAVTNAWANGNLTSQLKVCF